MLSRICCLIILAGLVFSCNKENTPELIINLEEEFSIELWEHLNQNSKQFQLNFRTFKKTFSCANYGLNLNNSQVGNNLFVTLLDVQEPIDCQAGNGPAKGSANYGELAKGIYSLKINLNDEVANNGILEISDDKYSLQMESENGISIEEEVLYKIPSGLFWGGAQINDRAVWENFLQDLAMISQPITLNQGNYGHFKNETNRLVLPLDFEIANPETFAYTLSGNISDLKVIVERYRQNYSSDFQVILYTDKGEKL